MYRLQPSPPPAGIPNCKYDPAYPVTVEYPGDSTWNSDDFRLDILAADAILSPRAITARKQRAITPIPNTIGHGFSRAARGKDAAKPRASWLRAESDKPNPLYYAQRTVDVASARLWLIEGVPIDDVVTLLEVRRRFEIPIALPGSRAGDCTDGAENDRPEKDCLIPL